MAVLSDLVPLLCRTIYNMCTQKPPNDYSETLYGRYREAFSTYITERVNKCARLPESAKRGHLAWCTVHVHPHVFASF